MVEAFVPVLMLCLSNNPTQCTIVNGGVFETEQECQVDILIGGIPWVESERPEAYIAGLTCLEVQLLDEQA